MQTPITELFGIDVPILAFTHCRDVVAAVSKAGGMGVLGAVAHSPEQLEIDLAWIEDELDGKPYGVDLIIPGKYAGGEDGGYSLDDVRNLIPPEHHAFVDDILARYDVPALPEDDGRRGLAGGSGERAAPFSANSAAPQLEVALAHTPRLLVNALGPPPPHMVERCKEEGRLVAALAGKAQHAERHVNAGVDLIIAQGYEAGGHTGEVGQPRPAIRVVDHHGLRAIGKRRRRANRNGSEIVRTRRN